MENRELLLFQHYPKLKNKIPWITLLTQPLTSVQELKNLEKSLELKEGNVFIKRDDINLHIYGRNKLRKFKFIYANALRKKKKDIATIGSVGTSQGLA
ncbi:MAG: hypothetical protein GF383_04395 [Candidatus Lokiarchaeota archaeon]|nr:hypothetical protein [Candidatus Lokiarchaeota archaeon]MBD3339029.1 hypothetical protein [Candidatus Lokiarchaeota archaeon]